jgi:hypothetical protein
MAQNYLHASIYVLTCTCYTLTIETYKGNYVLFGQGVIRVGVLCYMFSLSISMFGLIWYTEAGVSHGL